MVLWFTFSCWFSARFSVVGIGGCFGRGKWLSWRKNGKVIFKFKLVWGLVGIYHVAYLSRTTHSNHLSNSLTITIHHSTSHVWYKHVQKPFVRDSFPLLFLCLGHTTISFPKCLYPLGSYCLENIKIYKNQLHE